MFTLTFVLSMNILSTESRLSRSIPDLNLAEWSKLDMEFMQTASHIHHGVAKGDIEPAEGASEYTKLLSNFLESKPAFQDEKTDYYKKNPPSTVEEARKQKNRLRKIMKKHDATEEDRTNFHEALRFYNFLLKEKKRKDHVNKTKKNEKLFKSNFYKFAKKACSGTLDSEQISPSYSKDQADRFYSSRYSTQDLRASSSFRLSRNSNKPGNR